jgi:hypothetical protein
VALSKRYRDAMGQETARARRPRYARTPRQSLGALILLVVRALLWIGFTAAGIALNMWGAVVLLLLVAPGSFWGYLILGLGAGLAGVMGGAVIGLGQVLALRRWLDGAASLGSFFSTVLASSTALASGAVAGWWVYTSAGDLAGVFTGVSVYGCVFGLIQRPMLDYMARHSLLWVPVNVVASILGAMALLAAFDVSGGRRDMLQFRYAGIVYALVVGAAFLWITRETRRAMAQMPQADERMTSELLPHEPGSALEGTKGALHESFDQARMEIHVHQVYKVYPPSGNTDAYPGGNVGGPRAAGDAARPEPEDGEQGPDVIDASYRVIS